MVEAIRASGKPAVGHNCSFDISYVLAACVEPKLPPTWVEYKKLVAEVRGCPGKGGMNYVLSLTLSFVAMSVLPFPNLPPCPPLPSSLVNACLQWFRGGIYDTKHLSRNLSEVFIGWTGLGDCYKAVTGGEKRCTVHSYLVCNLT